MRQLSTKDQNGTKNDQWNGFVKRIYHSPFMDKMNKQIKLTKDWGLFMQFLFSFVIE